MDNFKKLFRKEPNLCSFLVLVVVGALVLLFLSYSAYTNSEKLDKEVNKQKRKTNTLVSDSKDKKIQVTEANKKVSERNKKLAESKLDDLNKTLYSKFQWEVTGLTNTIVKTKSQDARNRIEKLLHDNTIEIGTAFKGYALDQWIDEKTVLDDADPRLSAISGRVDVLDQLMQFIADVQPKEEKDANESIKSIDSVVWENDGQNIVKKDIQYVPFSITITGNEKALKRYMNQLSSCEKIYFVPRYFSFKRDSSLDLVSLNPLQDKKKTSSRKRGRRRTSRSSNSELKIDLTDRKASRNDRLLRAGSYVTVTLYADAVFFAEEKPEPETETSSSEDN